jgi:hypothetical protein
VGVDLGQARDHTAISVTELRFNGYDPAMYVKKLHRFRLGLPWNNIVSKAKRLQHDLKQTAGDVGITWAVDKTGSSGVIELLEDAMPLATIYKVNIHGGTAATKFDGLNASVSKEELVGILVHAFEAKTVHLPSNSKHLNNILDELDHYEVRTNTTTGNQAYGVFKFKKHDDLVTSLALSLWSCRHNGRGSPDIMWGGGD